MPSSSTFVSEIGFSSAPSTITDITDVYLPPRCDSNFALHYRGTQFHVHTTTLQHHSAYFRTLIDSLQPVTGVVREMTIVEGRKRRKISACEVVPSSSYETTTCRHSPLTHCVRLPDEVGIEGASVERFHLFLRHLYFSSTLLFPPFRPSEVILSSITDDTPTGTTFPSSPPTVALMTSYALCENNVKLVSTALLSLFHYFDCRPALERCEQIMIADSDEKKDKNAWYWLPITTRFGLKKAQQRCIEGIAKDEDITINGKYKERVVELCNSPDLMLKVMVESRKSHKK